MAFRLERSRGRLRSTGFLFSSAALRHTSLGFFRILWSTLAGYIIVKPVEAACAAEC